MPPVAPMLAKSVKDVPAPDSVPGGWLYEPKWDGFRAIIFRDGAEVELGSRNERPLTRYFPEVVAAVQDELPERCVIDGEIVLATGDRLDFEALLQRIHPADSRVRMLAETTPAVFVAFDLLAIGDRSVIDEPLRVRRQLLIDALAGAGRKIFLTPASEELATAQAWFETFEGAGLDGIVAKTREGPYTPDKRTMVKVKHDRTADCVVAGYRWHKTSTQAKPLVGSLLLGLYDDDGALQHVGVSASFPTARRTELAPYAVGDAGEHPWAAWADASAHEQGRLPGAVSRWNAKKDLSWVPLRPELVVEVAYDHMEGTRFRHTAQFRRWRPDREPSSCTYVQLEVPVRYDLSEVLLTP